MDNASIKKNIIRRRQEKGLSQDEMAQRLGMSRNSYRNIERGGAKILNRHFSKIAEILEISEEELLLGFKPIDGTTGLEDVRIRYSQSAETMKSSYETELESLKEKISAQEETISNLHEIIESKTEIIQLLKRENSALQNKR